MSGRSLRAKFAMGMAATAALAVAVIVPATASAAMSVNGSANQVYVTGAGPGQTLRLINKDKETVRTKSVGSLGGVVFRRVKAGKGYRVRVGKTTSAPVAVFKSKSAPNDTSFYNQTIPAGGYGYLKTRDGTELAINVTLPGPASGGPYPTLVEYSGYGYADPAGGESAITQVGTVLGYAVVDVNMRGTGCSGGAFDYFETLQALDGYDVIETVARQPWVKHGKVGMMGVSYGGISQLFVGATQPPSLAAITPLSVIDNTATTLYPGGILNTGFALEWAKDRVDDAKPAGPAPDQGQRWAWKRIQEGDAKCAANQTLHTAAADLIAKINTNRFYRPQTADPLNPAKFVHKINRPVFLACQFNDEQTGAHCPNLADRFTGTNLKWFTYTNGLHIDSLDPETFNRWFDFLELYVNQQKPTLPPGAPAFASIIYSQAMGVDGVTLPPDPIRDQPTYAAARAAYEGLPRVRVLMDSGAGGAPNKPVPGFELNYDRFPIPNTTARSWYFGAGGALLDKPTATPGRDTFLWDKESRPADDFVGTNTGGGDLWTDTPSYDWKQPPAGTAASYVSPPLATDHAIIGAGTVHAWVKANVPDVDLQVTVSEVRPDGKETYVQSGWLRSSLRDLDEGQSSLLEPVLSLRRSSARKLPKRQFTKLVIPLYYQGHMYRAGSRIRITITPPAGDQPVWSFAETVPSTDANVTVAFSRKKQSRLILPLIPNTNAPTPLPQCPALRGEPCRVFTP